LEIIEGTGWQIFKNGRLKAEAQSDNGKDVFAEK